MTLPRETKASPRSLRLPRMECKKSQSLINQIQSYEGCYKMYYPSVGGCFHIFILLPVRGIYTSAHKHATHTASLEEEHSSQS